MKKKVLVAMSGGVDSSVAAALLSEWGYDVVGATMQIWSGNEKAEKADKDGGCCSLPAMKDARAVAEQLGIMHYVFDFRDIFFNRVITNFCDEYKRGRTPNPCIRCNQYVKWETFLDLARSLEMDYMATGHYAQIDRDAVSSRYLLRKGADPAKDQSYVLYTMTQDQLAQTLLPLGDFTKAQIRQKARQLDLPVAERPESQEICFIPDNDYRRYLTEHVSLAIKPGKIVNLQGEVLGEHKGLPFYTIGQRKGLGLAAPRPYYVVALDVERNRVAVGFEENLYATSLVAANTNFITFDKLCQPFEARAKIRYSTDAADATIAPFENGKVKVSFEKPQKAITPGQAVVFYQNDIVVGGGTIELVLE